MDFDLSDEQHMLREAVSRFAAEHCAFESRRRVIGNELGFDPDHWRAYADLGWLALGLPEDVGGLACSFVETVILMQEFGRALAMEPYVSSAVLCARILDKSASELRASMLPALCDGTLRLALAHMEAGSRYSRAALPGSSARRVPDGFVLDGIKTLVFDAPSADHLIVSAALDGRIALFLVPEAAEGVSQTSYRLIDATRAADVTLRSVRLGAAALLAQGPEAEEMLDEAMDRAVLAQVAEALGAMEAVLDITNAYLKQRVQFGQVIGKFQVLQHRMSDMFVEVQATRSILYRALSLLDSNTRERRGAIAAARVVAGNAANFVGSQGIQLHGGIGMTEEYSIGHYYKKLVALEKRHGDSAFYFDRYLANGVT